MEIDQEGESQPEGKPTRVPSFVGASHHNPDPRFVLRRYWKSLVAWSVVVFVLVLVATLAPLFVLRDEGATDEQNKAMNELLKAEASIKNLVRLAFIPASSLALWVLRQPNFGEESYTEDDLKILTDFYDGNSPFQEACRRALGLITPQIDLKTIKNLGLAPHATISAIFPLSLSTMRGLGANLLTDPVRRPQILGAIFTDGFSLAGPFETITDGGLGLIARFPVFYEATNCSCSPSSPTSNDVLIRRGPPPPLNASNISAVLSSPKYSYGKMAPPPNYPEGRRFPTEVVYAQGQGSGLKTMFCDPAAHMGLSGLRLEDFGIEGGLDMNTTFLPRCRFFWGTTNIVFHFDELLEHGGVLDQLEKAGFSFLMTKVGIGDEKPVLLQKSSDYSEKYAKPVRTTMDVPGQTWSLSAVPRNHKDWDGDEWKWQLALAIVGAFFLTFIAFLLVFLVVYRKQYLKNVAAEFSDVSSVAMVQKRRAEASEKVAIENEAIAKKFLSTMSHELRTPLNSILAVSELMMLDLEQDQSDDPSALLIRKDSPSYSTTPVGPLVIEEQPQHDFEVLHDSALFLKQIVDDVLDFNKIEMGCLVINPNMFSPVMAVQAVARLAKPLIKDPNLYFRLRVDPSTPKKAKADEHRFKQIIMNLASNAIKFIKAGGLTISLSTVCLSSLSLPESESRSVSALSSPLPPTEQSMEMDDLVPVSRHFSDVLSPTYSKEWEERLRECPRERLEEITEAHEKGGLFVFVDVEDTGPGMTSEQRKAVFQPFFQSDPGRDVRAGGTGLGLSICSDLCKVMGGVIWATEPMGEDWEGEGERVGGKGTSFRFLLPLLEAEGRVSSGLLKALEEEGEEEGEMREEGGNGDEVVVVVDMGGLEAGEVESPMNTSHSTDGSVTPKTPSSSPRMRGSSENSESSTLLVVPSPSSASSASSPPPSPSSSPPPPILRVLLIDDSALNRLVFDRMLKSLLPCVVDQAANGEEGIRIAEEGKEKYDLVVCDLNMGEGRTGVEVGRELKKRLNYPFVMALFTADVMVELGGEKGAFEAVLYKPLSREVLVQFLMRYLDEKFFPKGFPPVLNKKKKKRGGKGGGGKEKEE